MLVGSLKSKVQICSKCSASKVIVLLVKNRNDIDCYPIMQVMFYTAMHAEMLHDHADYGFTVSPDWKFTWRYV